MSTPPATSPAPRDPAAVRQAPSRFSQALVLLLFLAATLSLAVVVNFFARREPYRVQLDATKTRAYSLSDASKQLLGGLQGHWTIALVMNENRTDRAMLRQTDEVLKRYTDASTNLSVSRIDPANPQSLTAYEQLLNELNRVYKQPIAEYEDALNRGVESFKSLQEFAQQRAGILDQVVARMPAADPTRSTLKQGAGLLALLAQQGGGVLDEVAKSRKVNESRPIPDYDGARSILAEALSRWATALDELAAAFGKWLERSTSDASVKQFAAQSQDEYSHMSARLAETADVLKRLPEMELSAIGAQLTQGECAVIVSPNRAAVIPSAQLFPKTNIKRGENNGISFDQRFRGEQLITATIRSLTVEHMPLVVFVHGGEESMLKPRDRQADLVGVASILRASRFEISEWMPSKDKQRPAGAKGQPVVWVVVPPPQRAGLQLTKPEQEFLDAVSDLIADGQSVLLNFYPSLVTKYGQTDPWASIAAPLGIEVETQHVIFQNVRTSETATQIVRGETIQDFDSDHVIARAVNGQQAYFTIPLPVKASASTPSGVQTAVLAQVHSDDGAVRWLEKEWMSDAASLDEPADDQKLHQPAPIAMAGERASPTGRGTQRVVVVGSAGWLLSFVADVVVDVGGGRVALVNPGNYELVLASVAWLAGLDELIAASPLNQDVVRLQNLTPESRVMSFWVLVAALPVCCIGSGMIVWWWRRR